MSSTFIQAVFDIPADGPFDYAVPPSVYKPIVPGMRVTAPFRGRTQCGIVVKVMSASEFDKPKSIINIPDESPVYDQTCLDLAKEVAAHYGCSWGEALSIGRPKSFANKTALSFSSKQVALKGKIKKPQVIVLNDPSGSNRLAVYCNLIKKMNANGRTVLLLAPDALALGRLRAGLADVVASSDMAEVTSPAGVKEEFERWARIAEGKVKVVLGVRAALFYAIPNIGMIIVDNEELDAYKEEQKPFYHVRDVALKRGRLSGCHVVLAGTAPSVEAWSLVESGTAEWMDVPGKDLPTVQTIDMTVFKDGKGGVISPPLRNHLEKSYLEGKKVALYFPLLNDTTGKILDIFRRFFPQARVERYDKDSKSLPKAFDFLLTTQALFKWQGEAVFDSAVILDIDMEINRMDFRSSHKAYALMMHLRTLVKDKLIVQTHTWDHPAVQAFISGKRDVFYTAESALRKDMGLPPYGHLIALVQRGKEESVVQACMDRTFEALSSSVSDGIEVLDPQQDARPILRNQYRFAIMCLGKDVVGMQDHIKVSLKKIRKPKDVITTVNVDP